MIKFRISLLLLILTLFLLMASACESDSEDVMWSAEDLTSAAVEKLVTSDPERCSGFIMSTQRVSINRGKWTIPISRECGTPDYLVPRDDLEMRNYGVITYDESTHNVDFVVFEDNGVAVMTAYAPLYIMEYPDVGFIAVDRAAAYSAPGHRYSLTLYDYSGNIVSNQTFSEISSTIDSFGLYMKSADYNELCVTDNGDIYIMTSDFIARLGYNDGKFCVEKYNELTALDDFADGNVVPVERSPQVMRGYLRRLPDGGAALIYRRYIEDDATEWVMRRLNDDDEMLSDVEILPDTGENTPIFSPDGGVWVLDELGLYRADKTRNDKDWSSELTRVMGFTDTGSVINSCNAVRIGDNDELTVCVSGKDDSPPYIAKMTKQKDNDSRITLIVAVDSENILKDDYDLRNQISGFNESSENYRIKLAELSTDEKSTANEKLIRLIRGGKAPDLVVFGGDLVPDDELLSICTFVDIDEALPDIVESYLPSAVEPFRTGDKLPYLPVKLRFHLITTDDRRAGMIDTSSLKNVDLLIEYANYTGQALASFEEGQDPAMTFLTNYLESIVRSCVVKSEKTCDFTGDFELFLDLVSKAEYSIYDKSLPNTMRRNSLLNFETVETPIELILALRGGEEDPGGTTVLNYPGCGAALAEATESFAIPEKSEKRDEIQQFIAKYINISNENWQNKQYVSSQLWNKLPLTRDSYARMTEEMESRAMFIWQTSYTNPRTGRTEWEQYVGVSKIRDDSPAMLTADEKSTVEAIFFGVKARKGADKSLAEIIEEESASCLAGFQTPEKTAKVLNKRVKNEIP